jgi:hypothetical protein
MAEGSWLMAFLPQRKGDLHRENREIDRKGAKIAQSAQRVLRWKSSQRDETFVEYTRPTDQFGQREKIVWKAKLILHEM